MQYIPFLSHNPDDGWLVVTYYLFFKAAGILFWTNNDNDILIINYKSLVFFSFFLFCYGVFSNNGWYYICAIPTTANILIWCLPSIRLLCYVWTIWKYTIIQWSFCYGISEIRWSTGRICFLGDFVDWNK